MATEPDPPPIANFESMVLGELAGIERIVRRWVPADAVDDVVQEVVLHACIGVETLRDARAFPGWVRTIAYNRTQQWHRDRYAAQDITMRLWDGARDISPADDVDTAIDMEEALRLLSPQEREAVHLRYLQGWTSAEIAARQGSPASTVRWRLKQALRKLRNQWEEANGNA